MRRAPSFLKNLTNTKFAQSPQAVRMSGRGGRSGSRGAYYKARYGGGRSRGGVSSPSMASQDDSGIEQPDSPVNGTVASTGSERSWSDLVNELKSIDQKQYGTYKRLQDCRYDNNGQFTLKVDHVQGDPYASPSRIRVIMPLTEKKPVAGFPEDAIDTHSKRVAVGDFLTRIAAGVIREKHMDESISGGSGWSGPKGGSFNINAPGQEILLRSSCVFDTTQGTVELRFTVTLPARGRTVMGQEAYTILITNLPTLVSSALLYRNLKAQDLALHVKKMLDQQTLRSQLATHGLVAFVGNGSILPRQSGAASLPMNSPDIVRFKAPPELEITLLDSSGSSVMGMGVPRGITVLTGGGFHGKSTLLEAIQMSVYDHIPGDGREAIVADPTAFKIRAEDGRSVSNLDISPFISSLPGGKDSARFSSEDASGSTSMAANIQEALELGCKTLLIDEDSSATNLLVRDQRMQALIQAEPITPFVSKARALFEQHGISTVIVVGGCGDYLSVADTVIGMRSYLPHSLTTSARRIVQQYPTSIIQSPDYGALPHRQLSIPKSVLGSKPPAVRGTHFLRLFSAPKNVVANPAESETGIDLSGVEQLVEPGQVRLVAEVLRWLSRDEGSKRSVRDSIDLLDRIFGDGGLDGVVREGHAWGDLVAARRLEVGAAINRLRGCRMSQ